MPEMSDLHLQEALLAKRPGLPIIVITAFPADGVLKRAEAMGAAAFFSKPLDSQSMIDRLDVALTRSKRP